MTYGVVSTGFNRKTNDVIATEVRAKITEKLGIVNFTDVGIESIFSGIIIATSTEMWETLEGIYHLSSPDNVFGLNQDNLFAMVNVPRLLPKKSKVVLTLENINESDLIIPAGQIVKQSANNVQWITLEDVTIPAESTITVNAESEFYGAYTASIGTIDTIVTPIAGWESVTNESEAIQGQPYESDADYKTRKESELATSQGGILASIITRIKNEVDGVTYVSGIENNTDITDSNSLLPHSISLTIVGGNDNEIATLLSKIKGDGINTNGTEEFDITDNEGNITTIRFNRPDIVDIYVRYDLTVTSDYDDTFNDTIKDNVEAYSDTISEGKDILQWQLFNLVPLVNNDNITSVLVKFAKTASPTTSTNITILPTEKARILRSNIVINTTEV